MAITASSISVDNTLEEFRIQFNNLVTDVDGISALNAFGESITFDGSTVGGSKTTITVVDPTAGNVIRFPNVGNTTTNPGSVDSVATVLTDMNADGPTTITSSSDVTHVLVNDDGVLKKITASNLGITGATAADDIATGDAAVNITTTSGNITLFANGGAGEDTDIIFKGTDDGSDITMLTLDGSDAGKAIFNGAISATTITLSADGGVIVPDDGNIGSASSTAAMQISSGGIVTFVDDIKIKDGGTIGVASAATAITIASTGIVTFVDDIIIKDDGTIGSASDTDAIQISSGGDVSLTGGSLSLIDGEKVILGSNSDIALSYDESTTDSLVVSSEVNDAALGIVFQADAGADAGDEWKMNFANGGVFTFGNDIASAGTHTTMLTITPNSTAASSTMAFVGSITAAGATLKAAGKETIYVPATAMYPTTTSGCAELTQVEGTAGRPELKCLDFDPSSDENAQFTVAFPKSWNESTITFRAFFTVSGTNTGTVSWALSGVATADNDAIDVAFGTAVAPTAKAHSGTSGDINVTAESGNVTIAGSPSTDEMVFFNILRDVSEDNQSGDARLLGIQIFFTTDAANDA